MTENDKSHEVMVFDLSDSIINDFLLVLSVLVSMISATLIVSNTIRMIKRRMFRMLIFLFYFSAFMAVLAFFALFILIFYFSFI